MTTQAGGEKGKPVARITMLPHRGRRIIVTIEGGDLIGLRLERCRQVEYASIAAMYDYAVKSRISSERNAKRKGKK